MSEQLIEGQHAVEAKLAEAGADSVRRHSFEQAPEAAPETGTPAETVSEERPRNELGQFVGNEPEVEAPEIEEVPIADEPAQAGDPAVQALLAKYGGDVDKALNAAVHAQRRLGELGNELGQTRQENTEYQQMIDELRGLRTDLSSQQQNAPLDQATVDWFDQEAYGNPHGAAEYARQQNNPMLLQRALGIWKETDPYGAAVYTNQLQNAQFQQQMDQRIQQATQLPKDATLSMALQSVLNRNPEFTSYSDALDETMKKYPHQSEQLAAAASSGNAQQLEGAIETLYALAERDTLRSLALSGPAPESTTTSTEVAEPTTSETREPAPPPSQVDEFRAQFKQEADRQRKGVWVAE